MVYRFLLVGGEGQPQAAAELERRGFTRERIRRCRFALMSKNVRDRAAAAAKRLGITEAELLRVPGVVRKPSRYGDGTYLTVTRGTAF